MLKVQRVMPLIPTDERQDRLRDALEIIGCPMLLDKAWAWSESLPAQEILVKNPNIRRTIRGEPVQWRDTYGFPAGNVLTPEVREFIYEYIKTDGDAWEAWGVDTIKDPRARLMVGFMNTIFHPEKPKRVTIK